MAGQTDVSWPVCEAKQTPACTGATPPGGSACLAHALGPERDAAFDQLSRTGVIDARGVRIDRKLLDRVLAAVPRGKNGEALLKTSNFDHAIFEGDVAFEAVMFDGPASFTRATFSGAAFFGRATFSAGAGFDEVAFSGDVSFGGARFSGPVSFRGTIFSNGLTLVDATLSDAGWFDGARFSGSAAFRRTIFSGYTSFSRVTFSGDVSFGGARFSGVASFGGAAFSGTAAFRKTIFSGDTSFSRATFSGDALFSGAIFSSSARFDEVAFSGDAVFGEAAFSGDTSFSRATFSATTWFSGVTFRRTAVFAGSKFEQARSFGPALAYRGLDLDDTEFAQPVQIEVSATGVCCRRARFPGGVQFRLRWARVVLDDADFPAPSILTGIPCLSDKPLAAREERMARAWQRLPAIAEAWERPSAEEISERPQLLSLMRANVAELRLSNITVADCRFAGAHNLDKMRLEADVSFASAHSPLGRLSWEGRQVIAEERDWRHDRARSWGWGAPWWPSWLKARPATLDPGQIAGLYRALRKGREDIKDEPGAADFYYGEMEMRRRARATADSTPGTKSRGRAERGLLTTYWLVSGYSLRAWRALACLVVLTVLFAVAFHLVGFTNPPQPASYWTSLLYAFRATLSLTDSNVQLTAWGQLLQGLLRLTGPVLLALALLALRGRVRR